MNEHFKYQLDEWGEMSWQLVKRPGRNHDFQKHGWKFWIKEGLAKQGGDAHCPLSFCPLTGNLMALNFQDMIWFVFVNEDFTKAYKKWAVKAAEKALLGQ